MSVARAESRLAAVLLVELMIAVAEEDDPADEPPVRAPSAAPAEPVASAVVS